MTIIRGLGLGFWHGQGTGSRDPFDAEFPFQQPPEGWLGGDFPFRA
jgi:hypothetical protein